MYGRFNIEACCSVINIITSTQIDYYLLSSVLACKVLSGKDMLHDPEYLFQAIFSERDFKIFRINNATGGIRDTNGLNIENFEEIKVHLTHTDSKKLNTPKEIYLAVFDQKSLNAQVFFKIGEIKYELRFPVKHINVRSTDDNWQVETGPVLMPFLNHKSEVNANHFLPAFIALNHNGIFDYATFEEEKLHNYSTRFYHKKESLKVESQLQIIE
ncbi:MAG: hypothetical protein Q8M15_01655 [Bacteroidota bacterium]|nr:hypothetical protein [Bacteroidota bacterium]